MGFTKKYSLKKIPNVDPGLKFFSENRNSKLRFVFGSKMSKEDLLTDKTVTQDGYFQSKTEI